MKDVLLFVLISYGMTQILVYGKIFDKIRPSYHFFHCSMCVGFWVGCFLFGTNPYSQLFNFKWNLLNIFYFGCLSSGTSYALCNLFGDSGFRLERS